MFVFVCVFGEAMRQGVLSLVEELDSQVCVCMYVCVCTYVCVYVCVYVFVCVYVYVKMILGRR